MSQVSQVSQVSLKTKKVPKNKGLSPIKTNDTLCYQGVTKVSLLKMQKNEKGKRTFGVVYH